MKRTTRIFCLALALLLTLTVPALAFEELSKGSKGEAVVELQNKLNELGYSVGTADGDFGGKTEKAIRQFQKDKGLEETGILDEETYNALFETGIEMIAENADTKVIGIWPRLSTMYILTNDGSLVHFWTSHYQNGNTERNSETIATDVKSMITTGGTMPLFVKEDGSIMTDASVLLVEYEFSDDWNIQNDFPLIGASDTHAIGLKQDGSWISTGANENEERDIDGWSGITQLQVGCHYTVGLKEDGTVIATGKNDFSQCKVFDWTDIVKISVSPNALGATFGLKSDGTVVATGYYGNIVNQWENVIDICAGFSASFGLTEDGEILSTNDEVYEYLPKNHKCENAVGIFGDWDAEGGHIIVVKDDGSIIVYGSDADFYNSCLNNAETDLSLTSTANIAPSNRTSSSDDAESNAEMAAVLDAFKELGDSIDKNGDGYLSMDELFK